MMQKLLSENDLRKLRDKKLLAEGEIALKEGEVYVAEHVLTKARRILNVSGLMLEAERKVLHG